jgi:hypothetical protein
MDDDICDWDVCPICEGMGCPVCDDTGIACVIETDDA